MARREKTITISGDNRDKGKLFHIREMPALQGEKWAMRLFLVMGNAGTEFPDAVKDMGLAGVAAMALRIAEDVKYPELEPLLDEMFACVQYIPDKARPDMMRPPVAEGDIEEISTVLLLRDAVLDLHVGFSVADAVSRALKKEPSNSTPPAPAPSDTPTSPGQ